MPPVALPPQHGAGVPEQTVWQKLKMGAMMGGLVGLSVGFVFGSFSILRNGAGPNGALAQLTQTMIASGATFMTFMSIGTVIRTDGRYLEPAEMQAYGESMTQNATEALRSRLRMQLRAKRTE